jgi:hypothetical protein
VGGECGGVGHDNSRVCGFWFRVIVKGERCDNDSLDERVLILLD